MTFKSTLTATAAILALAAPAYAESHSGAAMDSETEIMTGETTMDTDTGLATDGMVGETEMDGHMGDDISAFTGMTVDEIIGMPVEGTNGEDVGEIDYIVQDGMEYSAVIGIGGFLGLGEYTVQLPLSAFSIVDEVLVLDGYTEEELEAMPEVDESELEGLDGDTVIS